MVCVSYCSRGWQNLISEEAVWTGLELTVGLVPCQILYAAEILGTSRALKSLARGSWRRLWFCRILCWTIRGPLGVALPRISTAAAARRSLHLDLGQAPTCTWHRWLWGELTRGADSCGRGQREQNVTSRWPFSYGHRGDDMGVGRHVFLEKSGRKRRQTQTAATDATEGLARSLQESFLVSLNYAPCGVHEGWAALEFLGNISYAAPFLREGNWCCTSFVHG